MDEKKQAEIVQLFKKFGDSGSEAGGDGPAAVAVSETNIFGATIVVCGSENVDDVIGRIFGSCRRKGS